LTIAGQSVAVTQGGTTTVPPPSCTTFTLSSTSDSVDASGGTISVTVTTQADCQWTAASNAGWLSVVAGASGAGNGTVQISVAPNTATSPRTGTLTIAGQVFTVTQAGTAPPPCTFTVAPTNVNAPAEGGSHSVTITASDASCPWEARANARWIEVTSASSGSGSAQVSFSVAANTGAAREGTLTIAGQTVTVDQAAGPVITTVTGKVSDLQGECPTLTFVVDGRRVRTDAATEFDMGCGGLKNGRKVSVEGSVQSDGSILATHILR